MLGVCCGIPLLLRRDMQPHIALMLLALLLLVLAIFVPGLLAAIRLTLWLDGDVGIHSGMIMVPYLVALWLILVVIIAAIGFVIFGARRIGRREFLFDEGDDDAAGLAEILAKAEAPTVLVRESSTLFRRLASTGAGFDLEGVELVGGSSPPALERAASSRDAMECAICYENARDAFVQPCGHGGFCYTCGKTLLATRAKCPLCRTPIEEVMLIDTSATSRDEQGRVVVETERSAISR